MTGHLLTQAEYARRHGVTRPAVTRWLKSGLLTVVDDPAHPGKKLVDVNASDKSLSVNLDRFRGRDRSLSPSEPRQVDDKPKTAPKARAKKEPSAPRPSAKQQPSVAIGDQPTLEKVRTELLQQQTEGHKLKNAQAAGDLVLKTDAERRLTEYARRIRNKIFAVIRDNAEQLARVDEPRLINDILSNEFDAALLEIANSIDQEEG